MDSVRRMKRWIQTALGVGAAAERPESFSGTTSHDDCNSLHDIGFKFSRPGKGLSMDRTSADEMEI